MARHDLGGTQQTPQELRQLTDGWRDHAWESCLDRDSGTRTKRPELGLRAASLFATSHSNSPRFSIMVAPYRQCAHTLRANVACDGIWARALFLFQASSLARSRPLRQIASKGC